MLNRQLSGLLLLAGGITDTITTMIVISSPRVVELNPLIRLSMNEAGVLGIITAKLAVLIVMIALYIILDQILNDDIYGSPITFPSAVAGGLWIIAGIWNLFFVLPTA